MDGFLAEIWLTFQILIATFSILILGYNFNARWPRMPWDVSIDRFGFHIYIPIITSLVLSIALTILLRLIHVGVGTSPIQ